MFLKKSVDTITVNGYKKNMLKVGDTIKVGDPISNFHTVYFTVSDEIQPDGNGNAIIPVIPYEI